MPSQKGKDLCNLAKEGWNGYVDEEACGAFTMFWISNIKTIMDDNYAIGGRACYWILPHNGQMVPKYTGSLLESLTYF